MSSIDTLAFFNVSSSTKVIFSVCIREAISGTTPPNFSWVLIWVFTTIERTSLPFFTMLILVSSQLDSIANIRTSFI